MGRKSKTKQKKELVKIGEEGNKIHKPPANLLKKKETKI